MPGGAPEASAAAAAAARAAAEAIEFAGFCAGLDRGKCQGLAVPPDASLLLKTLAEASAALAAESSEGRPRSPSGAPGGLVRTRAPLVLVLPDLHARPRLLRDLLVSPLGGGQASVADALASGALDVICLGDLMHGEGPEAARRWVLAAERAARARGLEGLEGPEMEKEMCLSLGVLLCVARLLALFPGRFRCLKGNHDNLGNRSDHGDSPFYKYSSEGILTAEWISLRYGPSLLEAAREYELLLPLVAVGRGFCASHAEPAFPINSADLLAYRLRPDLVRGLIWTREGEAEEGSVAASLDALLGSGDGRRYWVSGHRALSGGWRLRSDGFVQIHDPERNQVLLVDESAPVRDRLVLLRVSAGGGLEPLASV